MFDFLNIHGIHKKEEPCLFGVYVSSKPSDHPIGEVKHYEAENRRSHQRHHSETEALQAEIAQLEREEKKLQTEEKEEEKSEKRPGLWWF